jgi:hypothetical protein
MVTIAIGPYRQAQGELISVEGTQACIRLGERMLRGTLITDLNTRPDLAQHTRADVA